MTTPTENIEITEAVTPEPCANCGSLLATDQRYCLNCGDRRNGIRLDFIDILSEDAAARATASGGSQSAASAADGVGRTGAEGWIRHNAGVLSLAALLLLTLVGGLAIGSWIDGSGSSAGTSKPQVIRVEGGDAAATDDSVSAAKGDSSDASGAAEDKAEKGGSDSTKGVQSVDGKSSQDIEKSVDKGEPLSTGDGELPPTDDKAAGGGSGFDTIE